MMRQTSKRLIKYSVISALILLLIWGLGPLLAIDGKVIFASFFSRVLPTLLLALAWVSYGCYWHFRQRQHIKIDFDPLTQLHQQIKIALKGLKRSGFKKCLPDKRSWVFLLGDKGCGKTSLITHSTMRFASPNQSSLYSCATAKQIDWWINDKAIIVDPIQNFDDEALNPIDVQTSWHDFLSQVKRSIPAKAPLTMTLTISIDNLIDYEHQLETYAHKIHHWLSAFSLLKRNIRLSIVITQCDKLDGFTDFFADLDLEERQQTLGFPLVKEAFLEEAVSFIQRLNNRLLYCLHHEPSQIRRYTIQKLPLQMEKLIKLLNNLLDQCTFEKFISTGYVLFTSSFQKNQRKNILTEAVAQSFNLTLNQNRPIPSKQKSYFVSSLFQDLIKPCLPIKESTSAKPRLITSGLSICLIILSISIGHYTYQRHIEMLNTVQPHFNELSNNWLSHLHALSQTLTELNHGKIINHNWLGFDQLHTVKNSVEKSYLNLIKTHFVAYLNNALATQITKNIHQNQAALYDSLQVYLMLSNPTYRDPHTIKNWFFDYWQKNNRDDTAQLMHYLNTLLSLKTIPWPRDNALIINAQRTLQQQPLEQTAFNILKGKYQKIQAISLNLPAIPNTNTASIHVSAFYDPRNFNVIYNDSIPTIAATVGQGNWVIGSLNSKPLTSAQIKSLAGKIQTIYLEHYIKKQADALSQIELNTPTDLKTALDEIKLLSSPDSDIWKIFQKFLGDPVVLAHLKDDTATSKSQLNLITFLQQKNNLETLQKNLQSLQQYVNTMITAPSPIKASYDQVAQRMENQAKKTDPIKKIITMAETLPAPINQWVKSVTQGLWKIMMSNAKIYVNNMWISNIVPEYQKKISNRYPIFSDATKDISIENFNSFFGPGGTLQSFFNYYLKPFVNTSEAYWTWKTLDGEKIPIPQSTLDMIIRASMIQKMFYSDNPMMPTIKFNLTPLTLSPNVRRFVLTIDGQKVVYMPGVKQSTRASWSGTSQTITMQLTALQPGQAINTFQGPWAWLRLVNNSHLEATSDPKIFRVTFNMGGYHAQYQLTADNAINPYQTELLGAFRCPEAL